MSLQSQNLNALWGSLIIGELVRNGVEYFCISPGSRSAPLTVAAARNPSATIQICYDERGAAFHALGYARASGRPAAVVTTSGTAVANCYPAVIEASMAGVPLIILSSDRPPELRHTDANQTIHQPGIFAGYCKWEFDLPCPAENISPRMVLTTVDQLVYRSVRLPAGPVHLNCMWREPLAPSPEALPANYIQPIHSWAESGTPYTHYQNPVYTLPAEQISVIGEKILNSRKGIILAGELKNSEEGRKITDLARRLHWPVFFDITSGRRLEKSDTNISCFDQILSEESGWNQLKPEAVIHFGGRFVSKRLFKFLEACPPETYLVISPHPRRQDPVHLVTNRFEAEIAPVVENLLAIGLQKEVADDWLPVWEEKSRLAAEEIERFLREQQKLTEIGVARRLSELISPDSIFFLASSMPVRDMDMYAACRESAIPIYANRGVSGIDGTIASAIGCARGAGRPVTLVIGDLAALHDWNSLNQLEASGVRLIMVLINNGGGGIFSFLPISGYPDVFETCFGTPHQYTFKSMAAFFRLPYFQPETDADFQKVYLKAVQSGQSAVIEVNTDREENYRLHEALQTKIRNRLLQP